MPQRAVSSRRCPARKAASSGSPGGSWLPATASITSAARSAVTLARKRAPPLPSIAATTGAAQQAPVHPVVPMAASRPRRPASRASAPSVSAAPTARLQLPVATSRRSSPRAPAPSAPRARSRRSGRGRPPRQTGEAPAARPPRPSGRGRPAQQSPCISRLDAAGVAAVHLDHRRHRAVEGAVELLQRQPAVGGGAPGGHPGFALDRVQHVEAAPHAAGNPRADPHDASTRLLEAQLRIVGGDAVHIAPGHPEMLGHRDQRLR